MLDRPTTTKRELRNASDAELLRFWHDEKSFAAREVLVERYQTLVRSIAGSFRAGSHAFDDYVQEGDLGLLAAIDDCDSTCSLSSYARTAIYRAIRDYKNQTKGIVYRPKDSGNSFKYRWAKSPAQKAMLLASEANCFSDPLSASFKSMPDWSFDYPYEFEDDNSEYIEAFDAGRFCDTQTFDRRGHEERVKLDDAVETLDPRARRIIEQRWLINECFDGIGDYIEPGEKERRPVEQEELAAFFGVSRQRIGQIETDAVSELAMHRTSLSELPDFDPHFVTVRWNLLTTSPRLQPEWCGIDALERLWEPKVLRRWSKPAIYEHGWRWFKPTIAYKGGRHNAADVWDPVPESAGANPKRNAWPYPRPILPRNMHLRIAHLHHSGKRRGIYQCLGNPGDTAKIMRMVWQERGRRPPGKPTTKWRYISPEGHEIPIDYFWPRPWRFPGWYPRPRKPRKTAFVFTRKGREWIPLDDPNAPEFWGDDGSLMTDTVGHNTEFAKGKGERRAKLGKIDKEILRD